MSTTAKTIEGYIDNGGIWYVRNCLRELKSQNVIVYVTRHYGRVHIGPNQFPIVNDPVKEVTKGI